ncbi:MAG: FAD:protein FMN transferase [Gemmatimonas sp.]
MEVRIAVSATGPTAERAARAAYTRIAALDDVLSDWRASSEVRRLQAHSVGTWIPVSPALGQVLALALDVARATDGAFDPTVGPLTTLWRESQRTGQPIPAAERVAATKRVGHRFVELDTVNCRVRFLRDSMQVDLGAVAKGWIIHQALDELRRLGIKAALIEAGGDLTVYGAPVGTSGWRISIPREQGDTVLVLTHGAVSTSGPGEQSIARADGARESHVFIPQTGFGLTNGRTMTVVGASAAITDALATALTLVPSERAASLATRYGVTVIQTQVPEASVRVMSFNLRYDNPADGVNAWPNRRDWVSSLIRFHSADIIGVQEALAPMLRDLDARLPGFARVGVGRADGRAAGEYSAILYRTDRLTLQDSGTFWLSPSPETAGSKGWDAAIERIATWARFTDRRSRCEFLLLNTHFDHIGEVARQESARLIRRRLLTLSNGRPIVMTGDLNSDPASAAYRVLTRDTIANAASPLHDALLSSLTGHYGPMSTWNAFKAIEAGRRIDYVLVSPEVSVRSHGILPDSWDGRFPSDHLPVLATVVPCR